jgi:hypothetical protein
MANNVVPFGKYKGQPVEAMAADRAYMDWLLAQPWFKDQHKNIYTLIINNFAEPSETPEHNALQALFLDDVFVKRVLAVHHSGAIYEGVWNHRRDFKSLPVEFWVSFERQGADVYVRAAGVGFNVEIKPSVGDDYPAVLRQIRNIAGNGRCILFLEHYNGVGATKLQFVELFNRSGVKVVFRDDAERQAPVDWSEIELLRGRVDAASREFGNRWTTSMPYNDGHDRLHRLDKDLWEALEAQRELLSDAVKSGDDEQIRIHGEAMLRGWAAANRRMEDEEIEKAKAAFPDAVVRIREK